MNTIAWLFILAGILIARQVSRGRVLNIAEDLGDAFIAIASGDTAALSDVLTRSGEGSIATVSVADLTEDLVGKAYDQLPDGKANLSFAAVALGSRAKGYKFGATGPDYYDCSGLMWRACQEIGYTGARFTTFDLAARKDFKRISPPKMQGPGVTAATINDIVLWPTHHMGVITGVDEFYSARSVKSGISGAKISTFRKEAPVYYRYIGPRKAVKTAPTTGLVKPAVSV